MPVPSKLLNSMPAFLKKEFTAPNLVNTKIIATKKYGSKALTAFPFSIFIFLSLSLAGMKNPFFAPMINTANPIKPPSNDGNSGPRNTAIIKYGATKHAPANNANGQISSPFLNDFSFPNLVNAHEIIKGINSPIKE